MSKGFPESIITQPTHLPSFIALQQESIEKIKADSVEYPAMRPLYFIVNKIFHELQMDPFFHKF